MKEDKSKLIRTFSESFKRQKVREIEQGRIKISELCNEYGVSYTAVLKWRKKYSTCYIPATRMVIEMESESHKSKQLEQRISELERIVGQKQIELDFAKALIAVSSKELGIDLYKDFFSKVSTTFKDESGTIQ